LDSQRSVERQRLLDQDLRPFRFLARNVCADLAEHRTSCLEWQSLRNAQRRRRTQISQLKTPSISLESRLVVDPESGGVVPVFPVALISGAAEARAPQPNAGEHYAPTPVKADPSLFAK
jgi:hypothetical protein